MCNSKWDKSCLQNNPLVRAVTLSVGRYGSKGINLQAVARPVRIKQMQSPLRVADRKLSLMQLQTPKQQKKVGFGSPIGQSQQSNQLMDDIECQDWLDEIDLPQYSETFATNFCTGGTLLSRKRLGQVRLQDFSKMNITNYEHQKILMEHIRHTLQYAYHSPIRRREVRAKFGKPAAEEKRSMSGKITLQELPVFEAPKRADHKTQAKTQRRRSFDNDAWQSISKLRTTDTINALAVEQLRQGNFDAMGDTKQAKARRRRWTYGDESSEAVVRNSSKGTLYGNMALEYDILQKELKLLQTEHINYFKNIIKCEKASMLFLHERTRELMLCTEDTWFRIPMGSGLAGHCAETGDCLNIPDAYADYRFNRNVDLKLGYHTRNVLCQPVRSHRGGGSIVGVIQMLNKLDNQDFDEQDEETLSMCVQRVADNLNARFKQLLSAAEKFAGFAIFVGERVNSAPPHQSGVNAPTAASRAGQVEKFSGGRDDPPPFYN